VIRLHLDEHIDPAVASGLRRRGFDVTTTVEVGLEGATDEEQLAFARDDGRVLVTSDRHFLKLHAAGVPHAGIAYSQQQTRSVGDLIRLLALLAECLAPEEMAGRVEFL
jgi:predicted nuclease of predicted toxin-antitoxin system